MEELVQELLVGFTQGPLANSRALRNLSEENWSDFLSASMTVLAHGDTSAGARYLVALLMRENALQNALSDPSLLSVAQAASIARLAYSIERHFVVDFARSIASFEAGRERQAERVLTILEAVSDSMQIRPTLVALLSHPNHRIRSKAALMIGRANGSAELAGEQLSDADPRVRANALEALWESTDPACAAAYYRAARDSSQRVATNAAVGLYKLKHSSSIRLLHELAERPDRSWQISAAWAMGLTGSTHFQPALNRLMNAGDSPLRQHAMRSLARIRQMRRISQLSATFTVSLWPLAADPDRPTKLIVTVGAAGSSHVPNLQPTEFVLFEGEQLILDYSVIEHLAAPTLAIGLLVPEHLALRAYPNPLRPEDQWYVEQFAPQPSPPLHTNPAHPASTGSGILGLDAPVPELAPESIPAKGFTPAFRAVIKPVLASHSVRHMICIPDASTLPSRFEEIRADASRARWAKVTFHAIVPRDGPHFGFLEALCRETGGCYCQFSDPDEIPTLLQRIQVSLLDHYEIAFTSATQEAGNLTVRICSPRGAGEAVRAGLDS